VLGHNSATHNPLSMSSAKIPNNLPFFGGRNDGNSPSQASKEAAFGK
jgi:hypothetical protein